MGTEDLIAKISQISGVDSGLKCLASKPKQWQMKANNKTSEEWLNQKVDWSAEALIGYKRRS